MSSQAKRQKGISVTRPFIYGNVATPLTGKKAAESDHTHKWTVCVRGVNGEDVSYFIKKVQFKLHETYSNPLRTVENPPFEVNETGWGEFEINIKIYFHPLSAEKAVTVYHHLRLHPYEDDGSGQPWPKNRPVVSYNYDEIVFNEPTEAFYQILSDNHGLTSILPLKRSTKESAHPFSVQTEQEELEKLDAAQREVNLQIERLKERMTQAEEELNALKKEQQV